MKLQMCRICLVQELAMFSIANTPLQEIYEKLTAMKLETNTSRPILVCYMCYARLWKCYHLRHSCLRSEEMFKQMLISDRQVKLSIPQDVFKANFLTKTPVIKTNICDIVHERDEAVFGNAIQIKTEATSTNEIVIKKEGHNTSASDLTNVRHDIIIADDPELDIKIEDVPGQLYLPEADDDRDYGEGSEVKMNDEQASGHTNIRHDIINAEEPALDIKIEDVAGDQRYLPEADDDGDYGEGSEVKMNDEQGARAKELFTKSCYEHHSTELKKLASVETENKEELLTRITNKVIITGTLISEDKTLYKLENITKLQENTVKSSDVIKQSTVCSVVNIKTSSRDFSTKTDLYLDTKRYKCDICNKQFIYKGYLVNHLRTHTDERPYKCDVCNKQFSQKGKLVRHLRTHTGERPYKCDFCIKQFSRKHHLVSHLYAHTGERPYKCDFCKKQFSRKHYLINHLRLHTGERPYKCDVCNKQYNTKGDLTTHLRTHTGERPYKCDVCNKQFNVNNSLVRHLRTHTGEKPYKCDVCNKQFSQKGHLVNHLRMHSGDGLYKCDVCNKQYNSKGDLVTHLRTHTGEKPYKCDVCNKQFRANNSLVKHLRRHTSERTYNVIS